MIFRVLKGPAVRRYASSVWRGHNLLRVDVKNRAGCPPESVMKGKRASPKVYNALSLISLPSVSRGKNGIIIPANWAKVHNGTL
jgi:hypothetical protein